MLLPKQRCYPEYAESPSVVSLGGVWTSVGSSLRSKGFCEMDFEKGVPSGLRFYFCDGSFNGIKNVANRFVKVSGGKIRC